MISFEHFDYTPKSKQFVIDSKFITYDQPRKSKLYIESPSDITNKVKAKDFLSKKLHLQTIDEEFIDMLSLAYLNKQYLPTEKMLKNAIKKLKKKK